MGHPQILVVEDENIVALDVQNRLKSMGYDVPVVASSGEEALRKVEEFNPDLVLMDIVLKGNLDGVETSERLRQRCHVPIVYLTAYADDSTLQRAKITEPFGYLLKPFEERELFTTIEMALYKHRMEAKLRETQQWLVATMSSIGDGVVATDACSNVRLLNPVAERLTGWTAASALGADVGDVLVFLDETSQERLMRPWPKDGVHGTPIPENVLLRGRNGHEVPIEGTVSPILDAEGNFTGFVFAFRDVSERRQAAANQRMLEEKQFQAQKMEAIGRLASGVAHDFNNLLTAILGNVSLFLSSMGSADPNRTALEAVESAGLRAAELVRQLLSFARQAPIRLEPIDLNAIVRESVQFLSRTFDPRIEIRIDSVPNPWPVRADAAQMHQVVLNLCLNARDAMANGGLLHVHSENCVVTKEHCELQEGAHEGEYVCLRVRDTGHGIPPEVRPNIFEPFFTTKDLGKGTGLGLAIVFGIVRQHEGWIEYHEVEPGSRFDVYLPRCVVPPAPTAAAAETGSATLVKPTRTGQATILLCDDEPMLRQLGRKILEGHGYRVLLARDGIDAIELFQREHANIDLAILDLTMPRLSGADAFLQMVLIDPHLHALFSSGYFGEDVPVAEHDHVLGFIGKPYRVPEMVQQVAEAVERVRRAGAPG